MRYHEIEDAERQLESMQNKLLRSRGWLHSCGHVANLWLWCKTIDGVDYKVDERTALYIESHNDAMEEFNEEPTDDHES